jgi:hypothetical protein
MTLLHLAVQRGNVPVISFLLENEHLSLHHKDVRGRTVMDLVSASIRGEQVAAVLEIYQKGAAVPGTRTQSWSLGSKLACLLDFLADEGKADIPNKQSRGQGQDVVRSYRSTSVTDHHSVRTVKILLSAISIAFCVLAFLSSFW